MAAEHEGRQACSLSDVEDADALWRVELMARDAEQVDAGFSKVDWDFSDGLYGVGVEGGAFGFGQFGDFFDREDDAGFVVGPHYGDQSSIIVNLVFELAGIEPSLLVDGNFDDGVALTFEGATDLEDGGVLNARGYDLSFFGRGGERAFYGGVVRFGAAACEYDFGGVSAKQVSDPAAGIGDFSADLSAEGVHAGRVAVEVAEEGLHFFEDFFGDFGSGVVVEVYCFHFSAYVVVRLLGRVGFFFDEERWGDKFSELCFDEVFHCDFGQQALSAHTSEGNDDLVSFDIYQLDVSAVRAEGGSDLLVDCLLNQLYFLDVGESAGPSRLCFEELSGPVALDFFYNFFYFSVASAASAACLAVVCNLLDGGEVVFLYYSFDFIFSDAEAGADDFSFEFVFFCAAAFVVFDGGFERFSSHNRAVHFLLRQAAEVVGDIPVGDFCGLVDGHTFNELGEYRGGCYGAGAAEGFEFCVGYPSLFVEPEGKLQRVAAGQGADLADAVGVFYFTDVLGVEKMVFNFVRVFPHY
jgi:hypothetical protein